MENVCAPCTSWSTACMFLSAKWSAQGFLGRLCSFLPWCSGWHLTEVGDAVKAALFLARGCTSHEFWVKARDKDCIYQPRWRYLLYNQSSKPRSVCSGLTFEISGSDGVTFQTLTAQSIVVDFRCVVLLLLAYLLCKLFRHWIVWSRLSLIKVGRQRRCTQRCVCKLKPKPEMWN